MSHPSQLLVTAYVQSYHETAKADLDYRSSDWHQVILELMPTSKEIV